ncbi:late embryogenesis abundant protein At5g17165-like [Lolium rigidum]|uniref:late embryogenesis abundant protein At5g17165-like n=1 Tax=Lolium rigidum TaxID=89674 RepID=UPI001F5CD26F|nr:late embryogenesis abundant protein At5g17165-like [Lolium rigidum]
MAAVAGSKGRIAGNLVARVLAGGKPASASPRRAVHASAYDKNLDDQVRPAFVPDDVIGGPNTPDKYWGPHPTTGVFGPAALDGKFAPGAPPTPTTTASGSVLDQKVWYRPLEDVEKPPPTA